MRTVLTGLLLVLVLGCGGPAKPPATTAKSEPEATPPEPVAEVSEPVAESSPATGEATPGEDKDETKAPKAADPPLDEAANLQTAAEETQDQTNNLAADEPEATDDNGIASQEPDHKSNRFALLAPGGPVLIDLVLRINGESHEVTHTRLIEAALAAADVDGDGKPTWEEVANSPRFAYGQFGNLPVKNEDQKSQLIRMYDRNGDDLVNRDELPRFLTRNAGRSRPFSLRSSNEYRGDNRSRSPVRLALDTDWDGAISHHEFSEAPSRLLMQDTDDDEMVVLADFKNAVDQQTGQMSNRRRTTQPDTALELSDRTDWGYAQYSLRELYAYGDDLDASDWPMVPQLFGQLDKDEDQNLDQDEVKGLVTVPAHIELIVSFGAQQTETASGESTTPGLQLEIKSEELDAFVTNVHRYGNRISMELRDAEIEFFVNEDPTLVDYRQVAKNQFGRLDTDQNGYLDDDEFPDRLPGYNVPLEGVDQNRDGHVYEDELATFLDLRQAAFRGQIRARAADQEDALFTALDTDGDGRLNSREVHHSAERLQSMDRNDDGRLQSHEIPGSMVVGFVRGNPQQDNQLFRMPMTSRSADLQELPRWFRGMDANGDGEISSREFIGPAPKFTALDANGDGFVSATELPADRENKAGS